MTCAHTRTEKLSTFLSEVLLGVLIFNREKTSADLGFTIPSHSSRVFSLYQAHTFTRSPSLDTKYYLAPHTEYRASKRWKEKSLRFSMTETKAAIGCVGWIRKGDRSSSGRSGRPFIGRQFANGLHCSAAARRCARRVHMASEALLGRKN